MHEGFRSLDVFGARGAFEGVGAAKEIFVRGRGCFRGSNARHERAHALQVLGLLGGEDLQKRWIGGTQTRYLATAQRNSWASELRLAAAFSDCLVLVAVCWVATLMLRKACVTCSKPICCWLLPPTIC